MYCITDLFFISFGIFTYAFISTSLKISFNLLLELIVTIYPHFVKFLLTLLAWQFILSKMPFNYTTVYWRHLSSSLMEVVVGCYCHQNDFGAFRYFDNFYTLVVAIRHNSRLIDIKCLQSLADKKIVEYFVKTQGLCNV